MIFLLNFERIASDIFPTRSYDESLLPDEIFTMIRVSIVEICKCKSSARILFKTHLILGSVVQ